MVAGIRETRQLREGFFGVSLASMALFTDNAFAMGQIAEWL
jgi:hypothetical protein